MNCDILYKYFLFFYNTLLFEDEHLEMFEGWYENDSYVLDVMSVYKCICQ